GQFASHSLGVLPPLWSIQSTPLHVVSLLIVVEGITSLLHIFLFLKRLPLPPLALVETIDVEFQLKFLLRPLIDCPLHDHHDGLNVPVPLTPVKRSNVIYSLLYWLTLQFHKHHVRTEDCIALAVLWTNFVPCRILLFYHFPVFSCYIYDINEKGDMLYIY